MIAPQVESAPSQREPIDERRDKEGLTIFFKCQLRRRPSCTDA